MDMTAYAACRLCPRNCGVDRLAGQTGVCGETAEVRLARAALHFWEEPCLSGTAGSGTVFFSGCSLRCIFCQNHDIACSRVGLAVSTERLAEIYLELQAQGALNINLVTADHFIPQVIASLRLAKERGLHLPVVYNCSGYQKVESLRALDGLIDIYLPDFKYLDADPARKYSRAADYAQVVKAALAEMVRQCPEPRFDADGIMTGGVIVRHLLLPGQGSDTRDILAYLHRTYGDRIYMSIMNQYTPLPQVANIPELNCRIDDAAYEAVIDYALDIGIEQAFVQEGGAAEESFIPAFDYAGVLKSVAAADKGENL